MLVFVPTPRDRHPSIASQVLAAEGVPHSAVAIGRGPNDYAEWLADTWDAIPDGFVVVEYDVAPFVGAVDALVRCEEDWCVHRYPVRSGAIAWALGLVKFSASLVRSTKGLGDQWRGVHWKSLDGAVINALGDEPPHVHEPPVAHAKLPYS